MLRKAMMLRELRERFGVSERFSVEGEIRRRGRIP